MKVIASIEARTGSKRLPNKVMKLILGKPMLELMIERVKRATKIDEIIIATSDKKDDDVIEELAAKLGVKCFRGSEDDVLDRVLKAAKSINGDLIVELWGDTVLIDPEIIDAAVEYYLDNNYDCVGTCLDKKFPWGESLLVFSTKVLDEVSKLTQDPVDRENVSTYIYQNPDRYKTGHLPCPPEIKRPELRLVVDELPDFELMEKIFKHFYLTKPDFNTKDIIDYLDNNPEMAKMNKDVKQRVPKKEENV